MNAPERISREELLRKTRPGRVEEMAALFTEQIKSFPFAELDNVRRLSTRFFLRTAHIPGMPTQVASSEEEEDAEAF